jgi:hypothetical protein
MPDELERFSALAPTWKNYTVKTASREPIARDFLLHHEDKSAVGIYMAFRNIYGVEALDWEPETVWITLGKDGINLSEEARNKLQAVLTLHKNPAFYWDNIVFQQTVNALNEEIFDPECLQENHPAHMAWAVYESGVIRGLDPDKSGIPEFDEDVQQYMAVCLKRAGHVYPPDQLKVVADNLEIMFQEEKKEFIAEVKKSWEHLDKRVLRERVFPEDALGIQLAQLASCHEYVRERANHMAGEVMSLEKD